MVHEKRKSGDPDYDDKVPVGDQIKVVRAGDGTEIARLDPALGPVSATGEHVNLVDPRAEELDTRPEPGGVAEVKAEVQTYEPQDVPREEVSVEQALTPEDNSGPVMKVNKDEGSVTNETQDTGADLPAATRTQGRGTAKPGNTKGARS
jgi:hypothetical protein